MAKKQLKKRLTVLQKHMRDIGVKGGNAYFEKYGSDGMRALVEKRWGKKKAK